MSEILVKHYFVFRFINQKLLIVTFYGVIGAF